MNVVGAGDTRGIKRECGRRGTGMMLSRELEIRLLDVLPAACPAHTQFCIMVLGHFFRPRIDDFIDS